MTLISSNKNRVNPFSRGLNRVLKTSSTKEAPKTHALTKDSFSKNDTLSKTSTPKISIKHGLSLPKNTGINVSGPQINHTKSKETEFDPRLTKNKKKFLIYNNKIAKKNSQRAHPQLLQKIKKLGYSEKDLDKVLKFIREEAPLNINFAPDKKSRDNGGNQIDAFINSKNYITYEGKKPFSINSSIRGSCPKYGTLNPCLDHNKSNESIYGSCYFVLQKSLKKRATFTLGNNGFGSSVGTAKYFENIINQLGNSDIKNVMETGLGKPTHNSIKTTRYIEAQYHGPIEFSKDIEALIIDKKYENTPYEEKLRIFAKKNNISLKWKINSGLVLNDHSYKNNIKECDINPNSDSTHIIPKEKILFESTNITDNNSLQNLKNYNYILGALTIQNMDISTLKLPQLSYLRGEITIKTTSGYNLSISKDLGSLKVPYNLLNTPHEKELRTFAKNNNLNIKVDYNRTLLDDKKEYKLSEINPDIAPNSTSNKTILKENIRGHIYIRDASDITQLKKGDCILGYINIENTDINTLILPQLSYLRGEITIKITSGYNLSISKDLDSLKVPYDLLNTPHEKKLRTFAKNNNLTIKWENKDGLMDDKKEYKLSDIDPNSTSNKTISRENIQNKDISIKASDITQLKKSDCILGRLIIQSAPINTLKLPQVSYVRDGITIETTSGNNLSISKDLDSVKVPHTLLNTPHEKEVRTFAKNNNLNIKWEHKDGTLLYDKKEYKLSELDPDIKQDSNSDKTILKENIRGSISIQNASDITQFKKDDCILGRINIENTPINTLKLPKFSYIQDGITIKTTSGANLSISKDFDTIKISYNLLNTPHEKEVRTFAKNNNLNIKVDYNEIILNDKKEYKLSELDPDIKQGSNSDKTISRENIRGSMSIREASDITQLKKEDCILGGLSIRNMDINTLILPQSNYTENIRINLLNELLEVSKDLDSVKVPYNLLNTSHEKEIRTFAKNNNLNIKVDYNGIVLNDKKEYKLSELNRFIKQGSTSDKIILKANIRGNINIQNASDIDKLKDSDCILGGLSIQNTDINTLVLPKFSYVQHGITIRTTSGNNLSISKDLDFVQIPDNLLNTPHEKEIRTFAKNNNLNVKVVSGIVLNDKKEYKLSELDPDIKQGSTSDKTILKENIRGSISIRNASDIAQLKTGDCILGGLSIQDMDINTLKLPQLSYVQNKIYITTKNGHKLFISKDLDTVKISDDILNTLHEKEIRDFAKNNNLTIKWQ